MPATVEPTIIIAPKTFSTGQNLFVLAQSGDEPRRSLHRRRVRREVADIEHRPQQFRLG